MDVRLQDLIVWPEQEVFQKTMPLCFQAPFDKKKLLWSLFQIVYRLPFQFICTCNDASTWFNYKDHNTVKMLIGIVPQGVVSFVSECWGSRVSDKYLTQHCGILKKLLPGDIVLVDRGFDVSNDVGRALYLKDKQQLRWRYKLKEDNKCENLCRMCNWLRYGILHGTLPSSNWVC